MLLSGLLLQGLLAEVLTRAPLLVVSQPNYVKKVVFPLEVLAWVSLLSSLFHALAGLLLLVVVNGIWGTGFAWPQLLLPLVRSEEHTSELQSLMRISYAVFCLKKKKKIPKAKYQYI